MDVSTERLNVTRNILRKYNCNRVRLFDVDGQSMNALAPPADDDGTAAMLCAVLRLEFDCARSHQISSP